MPTGCVSACLDRAAARFVQDAFMNDYFRIYTSYDIVGVELSGALKNVMALSCGICSGLGYQDNTKALLMTRAMAEITRLGEQLGGTRRTFGGLAGMGDLIVTCTSMHSRNNRAGYSHRPGQDGPGGHGGGGRRGGGILRRRECPSVSQSEGVEMPICECVYKILYHGMKARDAVAELMGRAKRTSFWNGPGCKK